MALKLRKLIKYIKKTSLASLFLLLISSVIAFYLGEAKKKMKGVF